jgi:hypothetical protein
MVALYPRLTVADVRDFAELNELYAEHFPSAPPARMTMQVPLPRGLLVSIGCVAVVEGRSSRARMAAQPLAWSVTPPRGCDGR